MYGVFEPNLRCAVHSAKKETVLTGICDLLVKFVNFSGVAYNKSPEECSSDRLGAIVTLEVTMRNLIDMVTGPCKQNQLQLYNRNFYIWLNLYSRIINDVDSRIYRLMNYSLDLFLSLLEGNDHDVLNYLATIFDAPLLYSSMTRILHLLWTMAKAKKNKPRATAGKTKEPKGLHDFIGKLEKSKTQLQSEEKATTLLDFTSQQKAVTNWSDLLNMYKKDDFEKKPALFASIKIYMILTRISFKSKKYQIFFDRKEGDLISQYQQAGFSEEDISYGKVKLVGETTSSEDLIVFYFMKQVTGNVEVLDNRKQNEICPFYKPPECFFLQEKSKIRFINSCNIENTEAKLIDMFTDFELFSLEMNNYQEFTTKYPLLAMFSTQKAFRLSMITCYFLAICINLLLIDNLYFVNFRQRFDSDTGKVLILIISILLIIISFASLVIWIMSNFRPSWIGSYKAFQKQHPYRNPFQPLNLALILYRVLWQGDVTNFMLHLVFAALGLSLSQQAQVFHLALIINISSTTQFVIQAITKHFKQLVVTIALLTVFVAVFSGVLGVAYADSFDLSKVSFNTVCQDYKYCFLTTLNYGLRAGGGVSDFMKVNDFGSARSAAYNPYFKTGFDLAFFALVNIICLKVIFAIIVDTFSSIRKQDSLRGKLL